MAILESIAAANAAYSVIRTALSNGKETANLMSSIGKFLSAEEDIKSAVERKKKSPLDCNYWRLRRATGKSFRHLKTSARSAPNSRAGAGSTLRAAHGIAGCPMRPRCARSAPKRRRRP
jgi:hypothetical protein